MTESRHPIDVHVGQRVKERRKLLKLTQTNLANALKLSFQQVQKYERGDNRFSASKLYLAAKFLKVPITYFFLGLDRETGEHIMRLAEESDSFDMAALNETRELVLTFESIKRPEDRHHVLAYTKHVAAKGRRGRQSKT